MNEKVKISVVTVCYNSGQTIEKTLESMLRQDYANYEYIIIDGGSSDNTVSILQLYEERFDGKMRYISEKDKGIYDAMNKGIRMASGRLVGLLNSNDWYEDNTLSMVAEAYQNNDYEVVYGMLRTYKSLPDYYMIYMMNHKYLGEEMITHPTCFVTKKAYEDIGCYDIKYRSSADYDLFIRFSRDARMKFTPVYRVMSNFSLGGVSSTYVSYKENFEIRYKYGIIGRKTYYAKLLIGFAKKLFGRL